MTTRPGRGTDDRALSEVVADRLRGASLTLAVAESCTGGLVTERLTDPPGASAFLLAGIVAYANEAKQRLLGVPERTIAMHGAVSREVAREMALGARAVTGADIALAITGVAGPTGGTAEKPVGTVWLAASLEDRSVERSVLLPGDRAEIRAGAVRAALALLDEVLRTTRGES